MKKEFCSSSILLRAACARRMLFRLLGTDRKKVTRLAMQGETQLLQHVCSKHSRLAVPESEKRGIANARFFSQTIKGPTLAFQERVEFGNDHWRSIVANPAVCNIKLLYNIYFTQANKFSKVKGRGYWAATSHRGTGTGPWRAAGRVLAVAGRFTPSRVTKTALLPPWRRAAGRFKPGSSRLGGYRVGPGGLGGGLWNAY